MTELSAKSRRGVVVAPHFLAAEAGAALLRSGGNAMDAAIAAAATLAIAIPFMNGLGGDAIALVEIDGDVPADVLAKVQALPQVKQAKALVF